MLEGRFKVHDKGRELWLTVNFGRAVAGLLRLSSGTVLRSQLPCKISPSPRNAVQYLPIY